MMRYSEYQNGGVQLKLLFESFRRLDDVDDSF